MGLVTTYAVTMCGTFMFKVAWTSIEEGSWPNKKILKRSVKEMGKSMGEHSAGMAMVALTVMIYPPAAPVVKTVVKTRDLACGSY
jgi:hypothetical protein